MAALRKIPYLAVYQYCRSQGLSVTLERSKLFRAKAAPRPVKSIFNKEYTPEKSDMVRPPAKYDNRSQEDVIDYYLKLER